MILTPFEIISNYNYKSLIDLPFYSRNKKKKRHLVIKINQEGNNKRKKNNPL